jgi:hypothetical protein
VTHPVHDMNGVQNCACEVCVSRQRRRKPWACPRTRSADSSRPVTFARSASRGESWSPRPKLNGYALRVWPHPPSRACAASRNGRSHTMQSVPAQPQYASPSGTGQANPANRKRFTPRKPLGDTPYFSVPIALYETGLARCLRPAEFKRYCTLLRVGNYHFGASTLTADLRELRKLDRISERASWLINRRLEEYGLIQILRTRPFTYLLRRPESWRPPGNYGPKITQASPLKVADKDLRARLRHADSQQEVLLSEARSA